MAINRMIRAVDLFCGAGGFSTGFKRAAERIGLRTELLAINHWTEAVSTHSLNHPDVLHLQEDLDTVDPRTAHPEPTIDLLLAAPECFPAGTLILTARGLVPIESVVVGERVLTHLGRWQYVVRTQSSLRDTVILSGHGHNALELTRNHKLLSLTPGPYRSDTKYKGRRREIPEPDWTPAENMASRFWATPTSIEPLKAPDLPKGLTWWIVGRWLADGSVGGNRDRHLVVLSIGGVKVLSVTKHLDASWRPRSVRTATLFESRVRDRAEWLVEHFGRFSHGKMLPAWALTLPRHHRAELLAGYVSGDGYVGKRAKNAMYVRATTTSKPLAIGLRLLAESLGHRTALAYRNRRDHTLIEGRRVNERPQWTIGWSGGERLFGFDTTLHSWLRVRRMTPGREAVTVYNLEVENDHSYIADGIVAKNCTSHSYSRGDKPISEQSRATAWHIMRWIDQRNVKRFIIENVPAFKMWGPTNRNNRPIKTRRGETYRQYLDMLRSFGYTVEARVLNAADYGGATTRKRLFIIGEKGTRKIRWPLSTHAPAGSLLPDMRSWRGAKEIIDSSLEGRSIFRRMFEGNPLAFNTMQRILVGGDRFWPQFRPWLTILRNHMAAQSIDGPVPTIAASGNHIGLAEPFLVSVAHGDNPKGSGRGNGGRVRSSTQPFPTVTGSGKDYGIADSVLINVAHGDMSGRTRSAEEPAPTLTGSRELGVADPFVVELRNGQAARATSDPLSTITTMGHHGVAEPIITKYHSSHKGRSDGAGRSKPASEPLGTVDGANRFGIAEPVVVVNRTHNAPRSTDEPVPCLNTGGHIGLAQAFLLQQQSGGVARPVDEPAPTVATKGAISFVEPVITDGTAEEIAGQPFLIPFNGERKGQVPRAHSVDEPFPTITTGGAGQKGLAQPVLLKYNRTGGPRSTSVPLDTLTTKPRYGLITADVTPEDVAGFTNLPIGTITPWGIKIGRNLYLDIRFRMLKVHELAAAMGFPPDYQFVGTIDDRVKQVGNAVSVEMAEALCFAVLTS